MLRHAVDAPQIAPIRHRYSQIAHGPAEPIDQGWASSSGLGVVRDVKRGHDGYNIGFLGLSPKSYALPGEELAFGSELRTYRVSAAKPLSAIVLAAGQSRRFGGGKLRALWKGRLLLHWAIESALACPVTDVIVVWGGDPLIVPLLPTDPRLKIVECKDHALGMGASLAAGIGSVGSDCAGVFVFLGDMPNVPTNLAAEMAQHLFDGAAAVAPEFAGSRGHPVLLSPALFPSLLALKADQGAGAVLKDLGDGLVLIPAPDDGCLFDIDRPDDLDGPSEP